MSSSVVKVNGTEVAAAEGSDRTVININFNQESSLAYLVKAVGQSWPRRQEAASKPPEPSTPTRAQCKGEQKVLGAVQLLLGVFCICLGVVMSVAHSPTRAVWNGSPFWMGSLFVVSGIFSVVGERRGGCWVLLAMLLNLASVVTSSVALAFGVADIPDPNYSYNSHLCERQRGSSWPYRLATTADPFPEDRWRVEECQEKMQHLLVFDFGVRLLLLLFAVLALGISLFCFGYGLRVLCCRLQARSANYVAIGDPEDPPSYPDPAA